jgi:hypothetical protein
MVPSSPTATTPHSGLAVTARRAFPWGCGFAQCQDGAAAAVGVVAGAAEGTAVADAGDEGLCSSE